MSIDTESVGFMQSVISRRSFIAATAAFATVTAAGLSACGSSNAKAGSIRIGTMPTEDILPMWVAETEGFFKEAEIEAEIVVFDSAQNLSAAITAGEVDIAMTDPMRSVKLCESGTELSMEWITLGATPAQGPFGVLTSAESGIKSLADLVSAKNGVGVAANTVPEYVFDRLCEQAGIDSSTIATSEVASLPERFSLVSAGKLDAAALPGSMLALGKASGMVVLADDTTGENVSQSVMVVRKAYNTGAGAETLARVRKVWDKAASAINASPEKYRSLLIEKANLNEKVADTYPISEYPMSLDTSGNKVYPPAALIDPQIEWMRKKGYSSKTVTYTETDGQIAVS